MVFAVEPPLTARDSALGDDTMCRYLVGMFLPGIFILSMSDPAQAFFQQLKDQMEQAARAQPKLNAAPPKVVLQEAKPENLDEIKKVYRDLVINKSSDDLASLGVMNNPCNEIKCGSVSKETVIKLVNSAAMQQQIYNTAVTNQQQAISSIFSAAVAGLSLLLSIVSLLRSRKSGLRTS